MFELFIDVLSCCAHSGKADAETATMSYHIRCGISQLRQQVVDHLTTVIGMDQTYAMLYNVAAGSASITICEICYFVC